MLPPTHIWPKGQHWQGQGQGRSPEAQVTWTQRFIAQTSSQRHPAAHPVAENSSEWLAFEAGLKPAVRVVLSGPEAADELARGAEQGRAAV